MKILITGFIIFLVWSALSTYIYVCKIKGLCDEPQSLQTVSVTPGGSISPDTVKKQARQEQVSAPGNLVIYFKFDKSECIPAAATERYVTESGKYLDKYAGARLIIIGHTDAIGTELYNQALGERRALSARRYFTDKGIPQGRIIIESRGEKEPVAPNNTPEGRAKNRRATITIQK